MKYGDVSTEASESRLILLFFIEKCLGVSIDLSFGCFQQKPVLFHQVQLDFSAINNKELVLPNLSRLYTQTAFSKSHISNAFVLGVSGVGAATPLGWDCALVVRGDRIRAAQDMGNTKPDRLFHKPQEAPSQ